MSIAQHMNTAKTPAAPKLAVLVCVQLCIILADCIRCLHCPGTARHMNESQVASGN